MLSSLGWSAEGTRSNAAAGPSSNQERKHSCETLSAIRDTQQSTSHFSFSLVNQKGENMPHTVFNAEIPHPLMWGISD